MDLLFRNPNKRENKYDEYNIERYTTEDDSGRIWLYEVEENEDTYAVSSIIEIFE